MIDFSIFIVIMLSGLLSYFHGFVRELFSVLAWVLSLVLALIFLQSFANLLIMLVPDYPDLRSAIAFISLFFMNFILFEWLSYLILNSIGHTGISLFDRLLAVFFGMGRGCVIVTLLILLAGLTQLPTTNVWNNSLLIQPFKNVAIIMRRLMPLETAKQFKFEPPSS
jgi:membrane protein required for colicin V production